MFDRDTTADATVSRRNVLKTTGGLIAGSAALAGFGSRRGAAATDEEPLRATLRERNEEYIAVEVWFPQETYDEIKPTKDVYLGDADQFVVHDEEDTVSLPDEHERLATPVAMEDLGSEGTMHGKLMYFRTGDADWPKEYEGVDVTLAVGAFPERTIPGPKWDTTPGLWIDVRELTEDYVEIGMRPPDGVGLDEIDFASQAILGHAERFVIHEEEDAVSLPGDTDGLTTPVEMDFENPHELTTYFRREDIADGDGWPFSEAEGEEVSLGLGIFDERTVSGVRWDGATFHGSTGPY